jgi:hypothetical protein
LLRSEGRVSLRRTLAVTAALLPALLAVPGVPSGREGEAPKMTFYPSLHLKFVDGQARNYFYALAWVVNVSGSPMTDLTLTQEFPEGFTPRLLGKEAQADFKRPVGFNESLEKNTYTIKLPELRLAEATPLAVELTYQGRPAAVTFPGVRAEFMQGGQRTTEKGPDQTWDLSKYTKYSGTLQEFIKRYAGLELKLPNKDEDWGFSALVARAAGHFPTGVVEVESEASGRMRFAIQAGILGNLRQMMLARRAYNPARELKASDEVRRFIMDSVQATADFTIDGDNMVIQRKRVGRWEAWEANTRWRDKVKDRMGEGPSRWYVFADEKSGNQFVIHIAAQAIGPAGGKSDDTVTAREQDLMSEMEGIVASLRIL